MKVCVKLWVLMGIMGLLSSCVTRPPQNLSDICSIFEEKKAWYKAAKRSEKKWRIPLTTSMAILYQESRFKARAKPPRRYWLGFIPGPRPSSAYGYAQALDATWEQYRSATRQWSADRDDFADAIDFVGWYGRDAIQHLGVSATDTYALYLIYHEGAGAYRRGRYRQKPNLLKVARQVQGRALRYQRQYQGCKKRLEKTWWPFWK